MATTHTILGIRFFSGRVDELLRRLRHGGLVVVPSGPNLAGELSSDEAYRTAVQQSDLAITDSGLMVLLWRWLRRERIERISGLKLVRALLDDEAFAHEEKVFWVMPTSDDADSLHVLGGIRGIGERWETWVAPFYPRSGPIEDDALLAAIEEERPAYVMVCIAGGTQERLGYALRKRLSFRPAIICIGAAIAFETGRQATIPAWADRLMLGWLFRCCQAPSKFIPRYWKAQKLVRVMLRHRERSPV